jgi:hypothetical protein
LFFAVLGWWSIVMAITEIEAAKDAYLDKYGADVKTGLVPRIVGKTPAHIIGHLGAGLLPIAYLFIFGYLIYLSTTY